MAIIQDYALQLGLNKKNDTLTGLPEMHGFLKLVNHILQACKDGYIKESLDIVYFDVRNFKFFNSEYGMGEGDRFLISVARIMRRVFQEGFAAHFESDHFVVLTFHEEVYKEIDQVYHAVKECHPSAMSIAAGVYSLQPDDNAAAACDKARLACDHAGSQFGCYTKDYSEDLSNSLQLNKYLVDHIDEAIEKGWIKTYYQPVMRTFSGEICSVEALARWIDPVYGFLSPNVFITVLENNHLIHKLDLCMIRNICKEYSTMLEEGVHPVSVSINLSRLDFEIPNLHELINNTLSEFRIPREMIHVEITESSFHGDEEFVQHQIEEFHKDGYQIWMDDFGAGYSSLNTLQSYDFDLIKLDMLFLRRANEKTARILSAIVSMAKDLGIRTLAEGVETLEQLEFLRQIGCEKAQGYYISKPLPMENLIRLLKEKNLHFENLADNYFFDRVGRVNVMSNNPLAFSSERIHDPESDSPFAIFVVQNGRMNTLYHNQRFIRMIQDFGHMDMEQLEEWANNAKIGSYGTFCNRLMQINDDTEIVSIDFVQNDMNGRYRVRRMAEINGKSAFAVQIINLTGTSEQDQTRQRKKNLQDIFTLFEIVDLINPVENTITEIYQNHVFKISTDRNSVYTEVLHHFNNDNIYPDDRKDFLAFMDPNTMYERIMNQEGQILECYFRMLSKDGGYSWHQFLISGTPNFEITNRYLFCIRQNANSKLSALIGSINFFENMETMNQDNAISVQTLWNTALQYANLGIFWKDADRRFLGANRMFLEYYGFESVNEILGKNDEDMGWHVDPGPYRDVEWKVIHEGVQSRNVSGTCIVRGERRQIAASKVPIYQDGRVIGLIGYFKDVTNEENEVARLRDAMIHDSVTGLLNNTGIRSGCIDYEGSYKRYNTDFAYLIMNIINFKHFNDAYGHTIGNKLLKAVADMIRVAVGKNSTIGYVAGDEFVVVFQYERPEEKTEMCHKISKALENIHVMRDLGYTAYFYMGIASYTETYSVDGMIELANKRLQENHYKFKKSN